MPLTGGGRGGGSSNALQIISDTKRYGETGEVALESLVKRI